MIICCRNRIRIKDTVGRHEAALLSEEGMKEPASRAPRNRALALSEQDAERLRRRLLIVDQPVPCSVVRRANDPRRLLVGPAPIAHSVLQGAGEDGSE